MAFTFVAGHIFTCCRLNESFAAGIVAVYKTLSHADGQGGAHEPVSGHAGCHGHGQPAASDVAATPGYNGPGSGPGAQLESDEACLSEAAIATQAQQANSPDFSGLLQEAPYLLVASPLDLPSRVDQPKPQNKSSPPLYLLTLRLLV